MYRHVLPRAGRAPASLSLIIFLAATVQFWSVPLLGQENDKQPEITAKQRSELETWLAEWEVKREELFESLTESVASGDRLRSYALLKELHGGGAGVDGSKFELFQKQANEERKKLAELETRASQLQRMNSPSAKLPADKMAELRQLTAALDKKIEAQRKKIDELEAEAFRYADQAVIRELGIIFEILGTDVTDEELDLYDTGDNSN